MLSEAKVGVGGLAEKFAVKIYPHPSHRSLTLTMSHPPHHSLRSWGEG